MTATVPDTPLPVTPDTEELRLATTMTGGVSLAIWMGGAAREIDLLMQASVLRRQGVGREAAAGPLSAAEQAQRELYRKLLELLDTVVEVDILSGTSAGGINAVLLAYARARRGDLGRTRDLWLDLGSMLDLLRNPSDNSPSSLLYGDRWLYRQLATALPSLATMPSSDPPPSTTLYVTTTLLVGESVPFTDALGTPVQNSTKRGVFTFDESALASNGVEPALALAGRATSSFPAAFEPVYLPFDTSLPAQGGVPSLPAMAPYANTTMSHWATDGGLLDNEPLDLVIERVFDRRARRRVRRVLLFVVPSTGPATIPPPADPTKPLGLLDGLLADLAAATGQSISQSLRAILDHNRCIAGRTDLRTNLADLSTRLSSRLLTPRLLNDYCVGEAGRQAEPLAVALIQAAGTIATEGQSLESLARSSIRDTLATSWRSTPTDPLPSDSAAYARFGQSAYDDGKSVALEVLGAAYGLATDADGRGALIAAIAAVHGAAERPVRADPGAVVAPSVAVDPAAIQAAGAQAATAWAARTSVPPDAWTALATALAGAQPTIAAIAAVPGFDPASDLGVMARYLGLVQATTTAALAQQIFDLAIAERAMLPGDASQYQALQLVQLSADQPCAIAPLFAGAADKLTGMQFHHFGAFYKRSWRANDWLWGRLDGCARLTQLLLDPARLRTAAADRPSGTAATDWILERLATLGLPPLSPERLGVVRGELAFLDDLTTAAPRSLPETASWVAAAGQRIIAGDELPKLAGEIIGSAARPPDWSPAATVAWAQKVMQPGTDVVAQLASCPVPHETFATDMGSPLLVRTLAKAAATTTGVLSSVAQAPKQARPALTAVRTVTLGGYRLTNASGARPRVMVEVGLVALVIGTLLSLQSTMVLGVSGLAAAAIGGYVLAFGVWQLSRPLLSAVVGLTLLLGLVALASRWGRTGLFGSHDHAGWIGRHVYVLGDTPWYPIVAVVGLVVLGAALSALLAWSSHGRRRIRTTKK